jgi:hypothetical protein
MSRDSMTTQDEQRDAAAPAGSAAVETYGLPESIVAQIMRLPPGDSEGLARLMGAYREFANAILMVAASHVGNAAVRGAIDIVKQKDARGSNNARVGTLNDAEKHSTLTDASDRTPVPPKDLPSFLEYPEDRPAPAVNTSSAPAAETKNEIPAASFAGARAYNAAHPDLVAEFNALTANVCCGDNGEIDPQAVARWQGHHGLPGDGKIGPHTVAAAKAAKAPAAPVAGPSPAAATPA